MALTPTAIMGCFLCLKVWYRPAVTLIRKLINGESLEHHEFLTVGIFTHFSGKIVDLTFWTVHWSASFIDSIYTQDIELFGPWFNVFDRQLATIISSTLHIIGYGVLVREVGRTSELNQHMATLKRSLVAGIIFAMLLEFIRTR